MRGKSVSGLHKYSFIHSGVSLPNHVGCEMKQMARLTGALLYRYTDKEAARHNAIFAWACVYVRCRPSPSCVLVCAVLVNSPSRDCAFIVVVTKWALVKMAAYLFSHVCWCVLETGREKWRFT